LGQVAAVFGDVKQHSGTVNGIGQQLQCGVVASGALTDVAWASNNGNGITPVGANTQVSQKTVDNIQWFPNLAAAQ
jgi:hypothetical protein